MSRSCQFRRGARLLGIAVGCGLVMASGWREEALGQDIRSSLFAEADQALQENLAQRSDVLVPKSFAEAMKHYRKAEDDLERGKNLDGIRKELAEATVYFRRALEGTELAKVTLAKAIAARDNAASADAPRFATELWRDAERKFREGAERLESGDVKSAQRRGGEAETLFRDAELAAIKTNLLNETWSLLEAADKLDVEKRAPETLRRARQLVDSAENQLSENRYDNDEPRSLAQEANYEARHALHLASIVESVEKRDQPLEELLLASEQPLQRIAGSLDIRARFDEGSDQTTAEILEAIAQYEDSVQNLNSRLSAEGQQIASLEARVKELEADLGGVRQEKSQLAEAVAAQARLRERFAHVEGMFSREEARVMREGNDVIIRLTGLTFASGKAVIESQYFGLLTSVQRAIDEFPGSRVSIEGHTDSFGGDDQNLKLSQQRADAVREYLLANTPLTPTMVDAVGYGETRPVASNETPEGRARNRRIEVIIHPDMATASR